MEKRDEIWGLQKRYRAVFHALATPHFHRDMPRTQKTAESLETKLDRGAFKSGMEEYQALHNLQEEEIIGHNNKFGDDSTDKNRLSSSTTPNEKSMLDLVDETESWLDKQEHVASQIHEEYRGMRDDWEAAYKQLPQEVEASATSKDYAKETLEGASALEKLRRVVPGIIHNTKKKLMQIFEST
ncbi:unnamed protein product [Amoebophrya sp. A25]|nr:unnamed protein product [Amoebophrya sp. A25]|eukprot:GSA25T00012340001.1